jgi:molecular chaperone HscB
MNYFDLFGLPINYLLDVEALSERYRELQKVAHPDRYANAPEHEQRVALQQATQINEAFEILRDPLKRAIYMLELNGIEVNQDTATTRDSDFLMQQMLLRERLAEVPQQKDPYASLDELLAEVGSMIKTQIAQLAVQLEAGTPDQLQAAREGISKMQFLNKLHNEAEAVEADLDDME